MKKWKCPICDTIIQAMTKPDWCPCCNYDGPGIVEYVLGDQS